MRRRSLLLFSAAALAAAAWQSFALAGGDPPGAVPARAQAKPPPSYKGTWFGTTGQGRELSFTVNKKNRLTLLELSFEIEGDGCSVEVEKTVKGAVAAVKGKTFKVTGETEQDSFTLTGRFRSSTAASGKLTATVEDGCAGSVSTTWRAKKGKKPPVDRTYDGTWEGPVSLPPGLDPAIAAIADPTIEFRVENGKVTFMSAPWVVQGSGCQATLAGRILHDLEPPVALSGSRFDVSFSSSAAGTKTWDVTGAFTSSTAASGTLTMAGLSGGFIGACSGSLTASWQATGAPG